VWHILNNFATGTTSKVNATTETSTSKPTTVSSVTSTATASSSITAGPAESQDDKKTLIIGLVVGVGGALLIALVIVIILIVLKIRRYVHPPQVCRFLPCPVFAKLIAIAIQSVNQAEIA